MVATLPDSDLELNEAAFRDNLLFDLCSGRTSEVAAHPAAQLAAQAGVARIGKALAGGPPMGRR